MKYLFSLLFFLLSLNMFAQTKSVSVTLKSGVSIKGEMREFDPLSHITLILAGTESKIMMSDIESIEELNDNKTSNQNIQESKQNTLSSQNYGDYLTIDKKEYPDSFKVTIEGQEITMLLVRGGIFNMGYDGSGSLKLHSEPVHKVTLSSYYVSKQLINNHVANKFLGNESNKTSIYDTKNWDKAKKIVDGIAKSQSLPYRLLTEAEWEYASLMPFSHIIFADGKFEWCSDYLAGFTANAQENPKGPLTGKKHVIRKFSAGKMNWNRDVDYRVSCTVRIAISAESIKIKK